ncbi:unnamed protein product [Cylindrotheca closterium]|uniref:PiggyBac transposable element-derived protein domain-containing protein n=1 Tax=Cylindrotheca closterium TaxID=2856 RepID=A0AAD2FUL2_9STRA|nr:unnamed protein product [Cylindrotheca closterium]
MPTRTANHTVTTNPNGNEEGHVTLPLGFVSSPPVVVRRTNTSPAGLTLLSEISSITLPPSEEDEDNSNEICQRSNAPIDTLEELVDSDDDDALDRLEPDDNSMGGEEDFQVLTIEAESAIEDRMYQLCIAGKPEGEEEDHCVSKKDVLMEMVDLTPEVKIPGIPPNWQPTEPRVANGEVPFDEVDNPGNWNEYIYRGKLNKSRQYKGHSLPSGAQPVPVSEGGKRTINGWEFHYGPWTPDDEGDDGPGSFRSGATTENMFPESRKGCLSVATLKLLGLTKSRMDGDDALFFYQLLYPICDPKRSGVAKDPREAYYFDVETFTRKYAASLEYGGSYGQTIKPVLAAELLKFHGIMVRDGVHGGSRGAVYRLWDPTCSCYDKDVVNALSLYRFRQIKRIIKLNDNAKSKPRGHELYDPAHKYDMAYRVVVANCNSLTLYAESDLCCDEMTWKFMGYGEGGVVRRIVGKPGVTKGGQVVMTSDASCCRPRAYVHRHTLHHRPTGFAKQGPNEVRMIVEKLDCLISKEDGDGKIFREKPHITLDNFFSGDETLDHLGELGFAATMTSRRDRLPAGVPKHHFHHEKGPVDDRSKAARFIHPITCVKKFPQDGEKKAYTRTHVSFQSTGSTNFSTVNAINSSRLYVVKKERGVGKEKRIWGVENNPARTLYLSHYGRIDTDDAMMAGTQIQYRSRKYWHSAMLHGLRLAIVTAYSFYLEASSGSLDASWKLVKPMTFHQFRDRLSTQMLQYKPRFNMYPGDSGFRSVTVLSKKARSKTHVVPSKRSRQTAVSVSTGGQHCVLIDELDNARKSKRLCGAFNHTELSKHLASFLEKGASISSGSKCAWCGEKAYQRCTICKVPLHNFPAKGMHKGKSCSVDWHNDSNFGLGYKDCKSLASKASVNWSLPSLAAKKANMEHIDGLSGPI